MYVFLCECGRETEKDLSKVKFGHTKSCGCLGAEARKKPKMSLRKPDKDVLQNRVIRYYKSNAKKKKIPFELTRDQALELFSGTCFYCGCQPSNIMTHTKHRGELKYNGIDRVNNSIGYVEGNVVSCCKECNYKKGAQSLSDFIKWIITVSENISGEKFTVP